MKESAKEFVESAKKKARESGKKAKEKAQEKAKESWDDVKDYTLEDIVNMSNAKVKELISKVDTEELMHALKDASKEVREKVIPNMTKKVKTEFERLESEYKKIKKTDLKKFKDKIENELRNLWK